MAYDVKKAAEAPCPQCLGRGAIAIPCKGVVAPGDPAIDFERCNLCGGTGVDKRYAKARALVVDYLEAKGGANSGFVFEEDEDTLARKIAERLPV